MGHAMVICEEARAVAGTLPRSYEAVVRGRLKVRVGRIVYLAFSKDESMMGFAFPKEERGGLIASDPVKFMLPKTRDLRYNWVIVRLDHIEADELYELIVDAWHMVVPKFLFTAYMESDAHRCRSVSPQQ
jgi:hypothetical protein